MCLFCANVFSIHTAKSEGIIEFATKAVDVLAGDGSAELAARHLLGCDEWSDIGVISTITSVFQANNPVKDACSAAGALMTISAGIGALAGGPLGFIAGNLVGNIAAFTYAWARSGKAKEKADRYHICYDEDGQHPLPYTDKQIAKLLKLSGNVVNVDNIVKSYDKLCIYDSENKTYKFYKSGTEFGGVYITNASGYAYVLCASILDACPCIYNIQRGKFKHPGYKENEDGSYQMVNGELVLNLDDDEVEDFKKKYAKHCRIIRYKDLFEQSNEMSNLIDPACYDMVGYAKAPVAITGPIVQCIEGTARNIFEKPIFNAVRFTKTKTADISSYYNKEIEYAKQQIKAVNTIIGSRTLATITNNIQPSFSDDEKKQIIIAIENLLYGKTNATNIEYDCSPDGYINDYDYQNEVSSTSFYKKYFTGIIDGKTTANIHPNVYCCIYQDNNLKLNLKLEDVCKSDQLGTIEGQTFARPVNNVSTKYKILDSTASSTTPSSGTTFFYLPKDILSSSTDLEKDALDYAKSLSNDDIFALQKGIKQLLIDMRVKQEFANKVSSDVYNDILIQKKVPMYSLFDIFRNNVKVIAIFFVLVWMVFLGWKAVTGNIKLKADQIIKQVLPFLLVCFVVFNDNLKNLLFETVLRISQGAVIGVSRLFTSFRSEYGNSMTKKCDFGNNISYPAKQIVNTSFGTDGVDEVDDGNTGLKNGGIVNGVISCPHETESITQIECLQYSATDSTKCIQAKCKYYELSCKGYTINGGGTSIDLELICSKNLVYDGKIYKNVCQNAYCKEKKDAFIQRPNFERIYNIYQEYNVLNSSWKDSALKPLCHPIGFDENDITVRTTDPLKKYSYSMDKYVYTCPSNYEMDTGFRLNKLIALGIIENNDDEKMVFANLSPKYRKAEEASSNGVVDVTADIKQEIEKVVIPTSVAEIDQYGVAKEIDFIENNMSDEGRKRRNYATYLSSKVVASNKTSKYPIIKSDYGNLSRNYEYLSFWDYIDCTALMYLTFDISGNGFADDGSNFVSAIKSQNGEEALSSALTGIWQIAKLIVMVFPFGLLAFIFFIMVAITIFLLLARATQQYCICVVNMVIIIYLSPIIFILFLFDVTKKKAQDTWIETLKSNLLGCCVPFVSLSLFMFILDWVMFGDSDKYVEMTMFDNNGVSTECYKGHETEAPIACLTKRLTTEFNFWKTIGSTFMLIFGGDKGFVKAQWTMMGVLVFRLLIGIVVFYITSIISNEMETKLYSFVKKPDTSAGFDALNGNVKGVYDTSRSAGWSLFKGSVKGTAKVVTAPYKLGKAIHGLVSNRSVQTTTNNNNNLPENRGNNLPNNLPIPQINKTLKNGDVNGLVQQGSKILQNMNTETSKNNNNKEQISRDGIDVKQNNNNSISGKTKQFFKNIADKTSDIVNHIINEIRRGLELPEERQQNDILNSANVGKNKKSDRKRTDGKTDKNSETANNVINEVKQDREIPEKQQQNNRNDETRNDKEGTINNNNSNNNVGKKVIEKTTIIREVEKLDGSINVVGEEKHQQVLDDEKR